MQRWITQWWLKHLLYRIDRLVYRCQNNIYHIRRIHFTGEINKRHKKSCFQTSGAIVRQHGIWYIIWFCLIMMHNIEKTFQRNVSTYSSWSLAILRSRSMDRPSICSGVGTPAISRIVGARSTVATGLLILGSHKTKLSSSTVDFCVLVSLFVVNGPMQQ